MFEPKTVSAARSEAARQNGKKSQGPVTQEGKEKSRVNALKYGFYSSADIVLPCESAEQFESLRNCYYEDYRPESEREAELVEEIVSCSWRLRRIPIIARDLQQSKIVPSRSMGSVFSENADHITKLDRHQRSLKRCKKEAIQELEVYQAEKQIRENEPKPDGYSFVLGSGIRERENRENEPDDGAVLKLDNFQNEPNDSPTAKIEIERNEPDNIAVLKLDNFQNEPNDSPTAKIEIERNEPDNIAVLKLDNFQNEPNASPTAKIEIEQNEPKRPTDLLELSPGEAPCDLVASFPLEALPPDSSLAKKINAQIKKDGKHPKLTEKEREDNRIGNQIIAKLKRLDPETYGS